MMAKKGCKNSCCEKKKKEIGFASPEDVELIKKDPEEEDTYTYFYNTIKDKLSDEDAYEVVAAIFWIMSMGCSISLAKAAKYEQSEDSQED